MRRREIGARDEAPRAVPSVAGAPLGAPRRWRGSRRPTMTDVAAIAGVSQSSVSLALNQMVGARISEGTRARVIEAARRNRL